VPSLSKFLNGLAAPVKPSKAVIGVLNPINTIMTENTCNEFPDIYIMMRDIGSCFAGANATSQAFLTFSWSVSSVVAGRGLEEVAMARYGGRLDQLYASQKVE
jgi:hypothetical protein